MNPAIFLDRDGVLDEVRMDGRIAAAPRSVEEFVVIETAVEAALRLHALGYLLIVVTNQPDIGRGILALDEVERMHAMLSERIPIDRFEICPHPTTERCSCRKPLPGMIVRAQAALDLDLRRSWTVGDRWVDVAAGFAAGTQTALVEREYSLAMTSSGSPPAELHVDRYVSDLADFAEQLETSAQLSANLLGTETDLGST